MPNPETEPWFEIKNEADKAAEILIYGRIGKSYYDPASVGAKDFADGLSKIPQEKEIVVAINSPGGNVWDGLAIYHQLQARRSKVTTRVDGIAASIASIIALAGRETRIPKNALLMIHDPSSLAFGTAAEMRKAAEVLDTHKKVLVGIYHAKTGKPTAEIEKKMSAETWFTGSDAKEFGLADTVTDEVSLTACAEFDLSNFKNVPSLDSQTPHSMAKEEKTEPGKPADSADTSLIERIKNLLSPGGPDNKAGIELVEARTRITGLETEVANLKKENTDLKAQHETALTAKENDVEARAKTKSQEILAKAGHRSVTEEDPNAARKPAGSKPVNAREALVNQYNELASTDPKAAAAFYAEHEKEFFSRN